MQEDLLRTSLVGLPIPDLHFYTRIGSTNDAAIEWAALGAADGSLVVADEQTRGRGRFNRHWLTPPGAALAFSVILKPAPEETRLLTLFAGLGALAVTLALEAAGGKNVNIKWPNDVLLDGRKTAGILVEAHWLGDVVESLVLGIGLNVAPQSVPPMQEVLFPATSVEVWLGRRVERVSLLRAVLEQVFAWRPRLGTPSFLAAWQSRLAFMDQVVVISQPARPPLIGRVRGLAEDGSLRLDTGDGVVMVAAGDVSLRPDNLDEPG